MFLMAPTRNLIAIPISALKQVRQLTNLQATLKSYKIVYIVHFPFSLLMKR